MKILVSISRIFVGILFIISGFVKLNDPLGFSYKLQEYFSAEVLNITFLEPYALTISIIVVVFEVVLGVFLLIGYKPKFTVWSLLLMIVFFTFLTSRRKIAAIIPNTIMYKYVFSVFSQPKVDKANFVYIGEKK